MDRYRIGFSSKIVCLVIAVAAAIVGVLGAFDLSAVPYAGYFSGPGNDITRVFPASPAAAAGLEVGDVVRSIDGTSVLDSATLARRPRAAIGETRAFVVTRDGAERQLGLTYSALPPVLRAVALLGFLVGLCFLALPLYAFVKVRSSATRTLAYFGLCFGIALVPGPYSPSYFLRTLGGAFATTVVILGFAFLVHFVLKFPRPRPFLSRPGAKRLIYAPAVVLALFFLYLSLFTPDATPTLNRAVGLCVGIFIVGYFGWAAVVMVQNFVRASGEERAAHGLRLMLFGTLAGLLPVMLSSLVGALAPAAQANLPGVQFYFLALGLIPVTFALATSRSARS